MVSPNTAVMVIQLLMKKSIKRSGMMKGKKKAANTPIAHITR